MLGDKLSVYYASGNPTRSYIMRLEKSLVYYVSGVRTGCKYASVTQAARLVCNPTNVKSPTSWQVVAGLLPFKINHKEGSAASMQTSGV